MTLLALLLALAPQAAAGGPGLLAREDLRFARGLLDAGYDDLAGRIGNAIVDSAGGSASPFSADEVLQARVLLLECEAAQAARLPDQAARTRKLAEVLADADALRGEGAPGVWQDRLELAMARFRQSYGELLLGQLEGPGTPEEKTALRKQADESFRGAEEVLRHRIEETRTALRRDGDTTNLERSLILDSYSLGKMQYMHARALKDDEFEHVTLLKAALDTFQEFGLDFGDQLLAYEGNVYQGLCHKELGQADDALQAFEDAIALRTTYEELPDGHFDLPPEAAAIVAAAVLQKAVFLDAAGDHAGAIAAVDDFLATIPQPLANEQGLAAVAVKAEAMARTGDVQGAATVAQMLLEADPQGPWGAKAREILARDTGGPLTAQSAQVRLRVIEALIGRGDTTQAHEECRRLRAQARGLPEADDILSEALLLEGIAYARDNLLHEACLAFETAALAHPDAAKAPDALWRCISLYFQLYSDERRPMYKRLWSERREGFLRAYPRHENAVLVQLTSGQELEAERDFAGAAKAYQGVSRDSPAWGEATFRAGTCLYRHASALADSRKAAEAAPFFQQALPLLQQAQKVLDQKREASLDSETRGRLGEMAFTARATIASILLREGGSRVAEVLTILEDVETAFAGDDAKITTAWGLRIRSLEVQGRLDEAVEMLDGLAATNPDARTLGNAAGSLARALDAAGLAAQEKDPRSTAARTLWLDAVRLYSLSVKGQLAGTESLNLREVEDVGTRLLTLALALDGAPESTDSFLDWRPGAGATAAAWDQALRALQTVAASGASYRAEILQARTYGFLGRWNEASVAYVRLFEREPLLDVTGRRFDTTLLRNKPELLQAWVEWCAAEAEVGELLGETSHLTRAAENLDRALANLDTGSRLWWHAKTMQIELLLERGQYEAADVALRAVERTTQDFDEGKYGARERLLAAKAEIKKRVRPN
jgi:tetratricopeptide (TPR) repeat protein